MMFSYDPDNPRAWTVETPVAVETSIGLVEVPAGFPWDGISVRQILRSFVPAVTYYGPEALVHDYLYSQRRVRRKTADRVFRELLAPRIGIVGAWFMYASVRLFGMRHWLKKARYSEPIHAPKTYPR